LAKKGGFFKSKDTDFVETMTNLAKKRKDFAAKFRSCFKARNEAEPLQVSENNNDSLTNR